ncbi:iron transporter [Vibrio cholerae]|nr:iron transporter [Vibrio cholerae]EGQ9334118.1 iron transporter [Vibrio cholerae]
MQLLCLSLVVMRCQPLRRALGTGWKIGTTTVKSASS